MISGQFSARAKKDSAVKAFTECLDWFFGRVCDRLLPDKTKLFFMLVKNAFYLSLSFRTTARDGP